MKTANRLFGAFIALSALVLACNKSDNTPPSTKASPENMRRLTSGTWVFELGGLDLDRNGVGDIELPDALAYSCYTDNAYTFRNDYSGNVFDSSFRCDTLLPVNRTFTWSMSDNEQYIHLNNSAFFGMSGRFRLWWLTDSFLAIARDTMVQIPQSPQPVSASALFLYKKRS